MIKNIFIALAFILSGTSLFLALHDKNTQAYVETGRLFAEFKLSQELDKKAQLVVEARKVLTDSLYESGRKLALEIRVEGTKNENKIKLLKSIEDELTYRKQSFDEDNKKMTSENMAKVWNQLNQYVNDFGKKNHYIYIFGATGQGNLMYAEETKNVTDELIKYVNDRYEDK